MRLIKYFLSYIFILILLFWSCSKEGPTASGPFTLNVDNQTKYDYDVYVNGDFVGSIEKNIKQNMGSFNQDEFMHFQAKASGYTDFDNIIDTRGMNSYTWILKISNFTLYVENNTNENLTICYDYNVIGSCLSQTKRNFGEFTQSVNSYLEAYGAYPPGHYWEEHIRTIGKEQYTWIVSTK